MNMFNYKHLFNVVGVVLLAVGLAGLVFLSLVPRPSLAQGGSASRLELSLANSSEVDLLMPFTVTVIAYDAYDDIVTGYTGTVTLTSTGISGGFPATHQFTPDDQGVYTFTNLVLKTAGAQTITASDGVLSKTEEITVDDEVVIAQSITWSEGNIELGSLTVTGTGTILTLPGSTLIKAENIVIGNGARISADGQGQPQNGGPGRGLGDGGGAGYGGYGSSSQGGGGSPYGSVYTPNELGSGGSPDWGGGGTGGGAIHLVVTDTLMLNGFISANGNNGGWGGSAGYNHGGGGGSGGSIWIEAGGILTGTGAIQANGGWRGGAGGYQGGGGAGGRIAIYAPTSAFSGAIEAAGGLGHSAYAGAGTIYLSTNGMTELRIDNLDRDGLNAQIEGGPFQFDRLEMQRYGHLEVNGDLILTLGMLHGDDTATLTALQAVTATTIETIQDINLNVKGRMLSPAAITISKVTLTLDGQLADAEDMRLVNGGRLNLKASGQPEGVFTFGDLDVANGYISLSGYDDGDSDYSDDYGVTLYANSLTVAVSGTVEANGRGYMQERGLGAGTNGGGAGYGGYGTNGLGSGGSPYGLIYTPDDLGSGGGTATGSGGAGGGAIHLVVTDTLTLNGLLSANGDNGSWGGGAGYNHGGGGGSGGAIWVETGVLTGTGLIQANGGHCGGAGGNQGGGGSGGRIAIYAATPTFSGTIEASGGSGHGGVYADAGTVYLDDTDPLSSTVEAITTPVVADGVSAATITVTLRTAAGIPIPGKNAQLDQLSGSPVYLQGQLFGPNDPPAAIGATNLNGIITATMTSTVAGVRVFGARNDEVILQNEATVDFTAGPVDAARSQIVSSGNSTAAADGNDRVTIQVTARDSYNNPVPNATVILTSTAPVNLPPAMATDAAGQITGMVTSTQAATAQIRAVISDSYHSITTNDAVTATFQGPDLAVSQSGPSQITAGYPLTYNLTIANHGRMTATNVVVTDTLPAATEFVSAAYPYSYEPAASMVVWNLGDLAKDETVDLTLQVQVAATATGRITNTLTGALAEVDLNLDDNQVSLSIPVTQPQPHLTLSPASLLLEVEPGQSGVATMTVSNDGQTILTSLVVTGPTVMPWVNLSPATLPPLAPGQQTVITLTATPGDGVAAGTYRDFVQVVDLNSGQEQRAILTVDKQAVTRTAQLTIDNDQDQRVVNAYIGLLLADGLVDVTPAFTHYVDVAAEGYSDANGQATLPNLPVGDYTYIIRAAQHTERTGTLQVTPGSDPLALTYQLTTQPALAVTPLAATLAVTPGGTGVQEITLVNEGLAPLSGIAMDTSAVHAWLYLDVPSPLTATLAPGESLRLTLYATPPVTPNNTIYEDTLTITAPGQPSRQIHLTTRVTEENKRDVEFQVTTTTGQPLTGAAVSLVQQAATVQVSGGVTTTFNQQFIGRTDETGLATFTELPLGSYTYLATRPGYKPASGELQVQLPNSSGQGSLSGGDAFAQKSEDSKSNEAMVYAPSSLFTPHDVSHSANTYQVTTVGYSGGKGAWNIEPISFQPASYTSLREPSTQSVPTFQPSTQSVPTFQYPKDTMFSLPNLPREAFQPSNLPREAFQSPTPQQFSVQLAEAPFSYQWNVTPLGQDYQIMLTITQVTSDSVSLVAPARAWTFATCDSATLTDNILIHNPSQTAITLTNVTVSVPGVNTTILNYPPVVAARTSGLVQVRGTRLPNSAVGQGTMAISATYRAADRQPLIYTLTPGSFTGDPTPLEQRFEQTYRLQPSRLISDTAGYYRLSVGRPALLDWIDLNPNHVGPMWLTTNSEITLTLAATAPTWLIEDETYTDRVSLRLTHLDTGRDRTGYLYLEVIRSGNEAQIHTHFELGPVAERETLLETVGTIEARVAQCPGGGGGGGSEPVTGGGSGGWDWTPLPDGSLLGAATASSIADNDSGGGVCKRSGGNDKTSGMK